MSKRGNAILANKQRNTTQDSDVECVSVQLDSKDWVEGRGKILNNMTLMAVLEFSSIALMLIRMENDMRV